MTIKAPEGTAPSGPLRGLWVHTLDETLFTRAAIEQMLDRADAAGVNTIIAQVARRHDAYYDSAILPRTNDPRLEPGLDVLAAVSEGARRRGMAVHAWLTAMPVWRPSSAENPTPPNWTYAEHGLAAPEADRWNTRSITGQWGDFLDPAVPAVQDLIADVSAELAAYDIDAVHLDYLRYDDEEWGYHPIALERFFDETGREDVPLPDDPEWSRWRRDQTTTILRKVRAAVRDVNPRVGVSAALIAWQEPPSAGRPFSDTLASTKALQPWPDWIAEGLLDVASPMLYFRESSHAGYHTGWLAYLREIAATTDVAIAPGQGSYLNSVDQSADQLRAAADLDGSVLFSYQDSTAVGPPDALLSVLEDRGWPTP